VSALVYRPYRFAFVIPQGQAFHLEFPPFVDTTTGEPYDFVAAGATARMDVIKADDTPVTAFATTGEDGVITLGTLGQVELDLSATFTDALTPTTEYAGANHGPVYGDLVITQDAVPWLMAKGTGEITRKVTT
jgi:hypothetical protein